MGSQEAARLGAPCAVTPAPLRQCLLASSPCYPPTRPQAQPWALNYVAIGNEGCGLPWDKPDPEFRPYHAKAHGAGLFGGWAGLRRCGPAAAHRRQHTHTLLPLSPAAPRPPVSSVLATADLRPVLWSPEGGTPPPPPHRQLSRAPHFGAGGDVGVSRAMHRGKERGRPCLPPALKVQAAHHSAPPHPQVYTSPSDMFARRHAFDGMTPEADGLVFASEYAVTGVSLGWWVGQGLRCRVSSSPRRPSPLPSCPPACRSPHRRRRPGQLDRRRGGGGLHAGHGSQLAGTECCFTNGPAECRRSGDACQCSLVCPVPA